MSRSLSCSRQWLRASFCLNGGGNLYEWWAVQLSNNEEAIIYKIWNTLIHEVVSQTLQINHADGTREKVTDYEMTNMGYWTSPVSGYRYSS